MVAGSAGRRAGDAWFVPVGRSGTEGSRNGRAAARGAAEEVLLLSGGAEGFAMLPRLGTRSAALIHPSFTEPELALREAGVPVTQVILEPPFELRTAQVPESADLVVLGNPTNPTSVLHPQGRCVGIASAGPDPGGGRGLRRRGPRRNGEHRRCRVGGCTGPSEPDQDVGARRIAVWIRDRLSRSSGSTQSRPSHWPLGSLQIEAITACCEPFAVEQSRIKADAIAVDRRDMSRRLTEIGIAVHQPLRGRSCSSMSVTAPRCESTCVPAESPSAGATPFPDSARIGCAWPSVQPSRLRY